MAHVEAKLPVISVKNPAWKLKCYISEEPIEKNPAYGTHQLSQRMLIVGPIQI